MASRTKQGKRTVKQEPKEKPKAKRSYGLSADEIAALKEEYAKTKRIPNPHRDGAYHFFIEAIKQLGVDKAHSFKAVKDKMRKLMSAAATKGADKKTAWQRFAAKDHETDVDFRIHQNAQVLQRPDYGLRLKQVGEQILKSKGLVVDILKGDKDAPLYKLNADSDSPVNELKRSRKERRLKTPKE